MEKRLAIRVSVDPENSLNNCNVHHRHCGFAGAMLAFANGWDLKDAMLELRRKGYNVFCDNNTLQVDCHRGAGLSPCGRATITKK